MSKNVSPERQAALEGQNTSLRRALTNLIEAVRQIDAGTRRGWTVLVDAVAEAEAALARTEGA